MSTDTCSIMFPLLVFSASLQYDSYPEVHSLSAAKRVLYELPSTVYKLVKSLHVVRYIFESMARIVLRTRDVARGLRSYGWMLSNGPAVL
jgi:hypothetical protein